MGCEGGGYFCRLSVCVCFFLFEKNKRPKIDFFFFFCRGCIFQFLYFALWVCFYLICVCVFLSLSFVLLLILSVFVGNKKYIKK